MSKSEAPKFVTALFSFKGKNNDELCFKKGDVITITQMDEEGWWEGTLHDKTGWFPSNYVKECKPPETGAPAAKASPEKTLQESPVHQKLNRDIVLKDITDSERVNVAELHGLINSFLHPLESANVLTKEEYKQLLGNVQEILDVHQRLLSNLETATAQGYASKIGNSFLTIAPKLKAIHTAYCANHPQAVCILDRYRDELNEFMERSGAISPGILVLTTGLSKPFRRLDKYSAMLQELERYTEKNHADRGDTQRSIAVYREIADECAAIRKQRELALQVLTSGIKGWEGEELTSLGDILYVGPVTLASGTTGQDRRDRYFVLFSTTLLVLSASPRMSSFVYEGKLPLTGIAITPAQDTDEIKNAFEISGPMIESILVLCATRDDQQRWIELLIQEQTTDSRLAKTSAMSRVSYKLPPYTRLSRYFAKLVRRKVIRPELLKKLLYLQYVLKPDTSTVKMRRVNVTNYILYPIRRTSTDARRSNESRETSNESDNPRSVGTPPRRKSTLSLEVKYAVGEVDLSTVGLAKGSSMSRIALPLDSICETSKSLPAVNVANDVTFVVDNRTANSVGVMSVRHDETFASNRWKGVGQHVVGEQRRATDERNACTREEVNFAFPPNADSVGSTDSGMVEGYRLNSSEIPKYSGRVGSRYYIENAIKRSSDESDSDENSFEHQCVCTSPFDSTPRGSGSSDDLSKERVIDVADATDPTDASESGTHENTLHLRLDKRLEFTGQRRYTQPIPYAHQTVGRKLGRKATQQPIRPAGETEIYTSGLYAHWWLKKPIPFSGCSDQAMLCEQMSSQQQNGKQLQSPLPQQQQQQQQPQPQQQLQQPQQHHHHHHQRQPYQRQRGIKTPWSIASLRPAPPFYTCKAFDERQFEEDAIILKVIEAYCHSVNARFTVHSGESTSMLQYDSQKTRDRTSITHSRGNWDVCSNRVLVETVRTLKNQMTELQSQMSLLTKQLDEERRSRLSLAATVKRSLGVADSSLP